MALATSSSTTEPQRAEDFFLQSPKDTDRSLDLPRNTLSKYKSTIPDPDVQLIKKTLQRLEQRSRGELYAGGNVSGGGEDYLELTPSQTQNDGKYLQSFQLGLLGINSTNDAQTRSGKNRIAVIDSGVIPNARVKDNVLFFKDFTSRSKSNQMCDESLHGTLVSDLIVQAAPNSELVILKVLTDSNHGDFSKVNRALHWIIENHQRYNIKIVNLSIVSPDQLSGYWNEVDEAREQLKKLYNLGILIVSAAGNDFHKKVDLFPASAPESITVGSYSHFFSEVVGDYALSPFSNWGYANNPKTEHHRFLFHESISRNFNAWVFKPDILAPGERLFACASTSCYLVTGTSFAAGLVSGGLFHLIEKNPKLDRQTFLNHSRTVCQPPSIMGEFDRSVSCSLNVNLLLNSLL